MLASFDEAEDAVQETFLRAWRARDTFDGSSLVRAWLYRIATNVCLDAIRRSARRLTSMRSFAEVPWLTPYPDVLLDQVAPSEDEPEAVVVTRETIELTFLAALQVLPAAAASDAHRPRRPRLAGDRDGRDPRHHRSRRSTAPSSGRAPRCRPTCRRGGPSGRPASRARRNARCSRSFIDAHERGDAALAVSIAAKDLRITMPPQPYLFEGLDVIGPLLANALSEGDWRLLPTVANRMPTAASYLRAPGDTVHRAVQVRRPAGRRRPDRRDHDVRSGALPAVRAAADGLTCR